MLLVALGAAAAGALFFLMPASAASQDQEPQMVRVINFPETQRVAGAVAIQGTIHQAALTAIREIEVWPLVNPGDTRRLVPAGTITTDGFGAVVLSLTGQSKGTLTRAGEVGVILVPDEEPITQALEERSQILFALEVKAAATPGPLYFSSGQPRFTVAFPRYRVFVYNTTDKTAAVDLYAYLTN
jgi:hypothetical protein